MEFLKRIKTRPIVWNDVFFVPVAAGVLVEVLAWVRRSIHGLEQLGSCKKSIS